MPLDPPACTPATCLMHAALARVVLASRRPLLLLRLSGVFLLRFAERRFAGLLFQEPPRSTRFSQGMQAFAGEPSAHRGSNQPPAKRVWRSCTVLAWRACATQAPMR